MIFKRPSSGFTMIELLVVATIIILLTAIGLVSYRQVGQNARNGKRKADLETVRQALVLYRSVNGSYPATSTWTTMIGQLTNYISATSVTDPKNASPYVYSYTSNGTTFTLTGYLEPNATVYSLSNP